AAAAATPTPTNTPAVNLKTMPLDQLVGAVTQAVSKLNRSSGYDTIPYDQWCQVAAVYPDFVVIREGLAFWKVPYKLGETQVQLPGEGDWIEGEANWVPAEGTADELTGEDAANAIKSAPVYAPIKAIGNGRIGHYAVMWGSAKK